MTATMQCPHCGARYRPRPHLEGEALECRQCGRSFVVHLTEADADSGPEASAATVSMEQIESLWCTTAAADATPGMTLKSRDEGAARIDLTALAIPLCQVDIDGGGAAAAGKPHYQLLGELGEGGMGTVYAARQSGLDRDVALKRIRVNRRADGETSQKFLAEAVVTGELDHPNIVPVYALGRDQDGNLFYAMKQIQGTAWKDVLPDRSEEENLNTLLRVADAVAYAHAKGVIHCDLKPANVMLGPYGEVLVLDWGLAVSVRTEGRIPSVRGRSTRAGTPAYMPPEMALGDGDAIGCHSDIYLLGGILYEIATGLRPHRGASGMACVLQAAQNIITPTERKDELVQIARTAMATAPEERYADVATFQNAVRTYLSHAESRGLTARAREDLEQACRSRDYADFARSAFGFREALELWPENAAAREGLVEAERRHAESAIERGDFDASPSPQTPKKAWPSAQQP